jgi:hypothetical protein
MGNHMKRRINIIVTCTKRKHLPPSAGLRLRDIRTEDMDEGFATWVQHLSTSKSKPTIARELYAGDHWTVVKTLEEVASSSGLEALVWVCSAGYGLIALDTKIKPYSATFSVNDADTVCKWSTPDSSKNLSRLWWQLHTQWSGPNELQPRSVKDIAAKYPDSPILVVASQPYLKAILEDVRMALRTLHDTQLLCVISAGTNSILSIDSNLLPCNATLQAEVGGSLNSLNARLARTILSELGENIFKVSNLRAQFSARIATTPPLDKSKRKIMRDSEVQNFILAALKENPRVSWTRALSKFRESGSACSQERFAFLFKHVEPRDHT